MRTRRYSLQIIPVLIFACMVATSPEALAKSRLPRAAEFNTLAGATTHCPADKVVWSSLSGNAFHLPGSKFYGKTKHGAYVCRKDALAAGFHAAKT